MKTSHAQALQSFACELRWLLALRLSVQLTTVWLFVWGVIVLALRILGLHSSLWLALGVIGIVPLIVFAVIRARQLQPEFAKLRANYDRLNACGGVMMAEETADMSAWTEQLPTANAPKFQWCSGRPIFLLMIAALFVAVALLLPDRLAHLATHHSLEIGQVVEQLQAEVKTLAQEKIVPEKKADELQKQLAQLQKDSSSYDPGKTWEALDHIKQADSDAAKAAADEALKKTESLTQAETLAQAMQTAADKGMNAETASQAAQDLATLLNSAKLEEGIMNNKIPPELLAGLNGLNKEQMQKLAAALAANKSSLSSMVGNLANLKMIDAATLAKMSAAGKGGNSAALADYLAQCQGGGEDEIFSWLAKAGKGGTGGGGPEGNMMWDNDTSEKDVKFQERALPPSAHLSDAQTVGVSKAAPELAANDISAQHGALDNAVASGGSAHAQVILPEQRQAVQNFFKREGK